VKSLIRLAVALALWEGSAALLAVSVTLGGAGRICGAVKSPLGSIVPQVAPLQPDPVTLQFTAVLLELLTVGVNCCVAPSLTEAVDGEMLTLTAGGGGGGGGGPALPPAAPPLHPIAPAPAAKIAHSKIT
jgi:hypothetical protein